MLRPAATRPRRATGHLLLRPRPERASRGELQAEFQPERPSAVRVFPGTDITRVALTVVASPCPLCARVCPCESLHYATATHSPSSTLVSGLSSEPVLTKLQLRKILHWCHAHDEPNARLGQQGVRLPTGQRRDQPLRRKTETSAVILENEISEVET